MKKEKYLSMIPPALLVTAMVASPAAWANVTLYGVADVGLFSTQQKIAGVQERTTGLVSGGQAASRWGLRGTEDLGNGLQAKFQFEGGINATTGEVLNQNRHFGRSAWLGIGGRLGDLQLGRQTTSSSDFFAPAASPFGNAFSQAGIGKSGFRASNTVFQDRVVKYISPRFQGFDLGASYSFNTRGEQQQRSENTQSTSVSLRYQGDKTTLVATYDRVSPANSDPNAHGHRPSAIQLGGNHLLGAVHIYAGWSQQKDGWIKSSDGAATGSNHLGQSGYFDGSVDAWLLGAKLTTQRHQWFGTLQYVDPERKAFPAGEAVHVFNAGYTYDFSKRTNFYVVASYFDGDLYGFERDSHSRQFGFGLRHRF